MDTPRGQTSRHIRRAIAGDLSQLDYVVVRVQPFLRKLAEYRLRRVPPNQVDPEDLIQHAWLKALSIVQEMDPEDGRVTPRLMAFLGEVVRNKAKDELVKAIRRGPHARVAAGETGAVDLADPTVGRLTRAAQQDGVRAMEAALDALDEGVREILLLRGFEQLSFAEIATSLSISEATARQRYHRALERARVAMPGSLVEDFAVVA